MDYYKNVVREVLEELVEQGDETREEILRRWSKGDTQDDFGNMTGSRTCSTYEAEEALKEAGFPWDAELVDLLESVGYNVGELVERGAEVVDVVLCELVASEMVSELQAEA